MSEKNEESAVAGKKVSRRSMLKWTGALAAAAALGAVASYGATELVKPPPEIVPSQPAAAPNEVVLTCATDAGPFLAHVVNGVFVKSEPIAPNETVGPLAFMLRNWLYAPDRIRYPMKRVDFDPGGNRNTQTRGQMRYVRITWNEALDMVANELKRVVDKYTASAIAVQGGHSWSGVLHQGRIQNNGGGWGSKLLGLLGEYLVIDSVGSVPGWSAAVYLMMGGVPSMSSYGIYNNSGIPTSTIIPDQNSLSDIEKNCKLIVYTGTDHACKWYGFTDVAPWFLRFKKAGIKQIVIDPWQNDTAALFADKWIPIVPGTDEALFAAIAYVWITKNLYDKEYVTTHTVGFEKFRDYILGNEDGVPKTPQWAEKICGIDQRTIQALAEEWASKPTVTWSMNSANNRRQYAVEYCRMVITLQAMMGYIGKPGTGIGGGWRPKTTAPVGMRGPPTVPFGPHPSGNTYPNLPPRITAQGFAQAIRNPPFNYTEFDFEAVYPEPGRPEIHMIYSTGGSGSFLNQRPNINANTEALQSSKIEFVVTQNPFWDAITYYSDVVLPVTMFGEREDIVNWQNYSIFSHKVAEPPGEAMNDLDVWRGLATRLGILDKLTGGQTDEQMLRAQYAKSNIPLTYDAFKATGYYRWPLEEQGPFVAYKAFNDDPSKNPPALIGPLPSGKIEIYSSKIANFYGPNDPEAPPIPKYIEYEDPSGGKYPLHYHCGQHPKRGRHSQWQNTSWKRDFENDYINGYRTLWMNSADAAARGIKYGDIVRVFNDLGQILCGAKPSERMMPGFVFNSEGAHYTPREPGVSDTLDLGGNGNVLLPAVNPEKCAQGCITHGYVEVERWTP
jgi:molybdopterin guanine dinucleotide-containing S/N-oxide reductase-like protein